MTKRVPIWVTGVPAVMLFSFLIYCSRGSSDAPLTQEQLTKRGEYLVNFGGCHDCHSPKKYTEQGPIPDQSILLSGHPARERVPQIPEGLLTPDGWVAVTNAHITAWGGPWGISFATNLTRDERTGLGIWKEDDFIKAMRTGKHLGVGRDILPPMPWQNIGQLTDEDLKAIFAYLKSMPAVPNFVPGPIDPVEGAGN